MSHRVYNQMWAEAQALLSDVIASEMPEKRVKYEDQNALFQTCVATYIKYIQIFRNLETCDDQIAHPQKRRVLRNVLEGVMGRIVELKDEMVSIDSFEFQFFDDILSDLKLAPEQIDIPVPRYFVRERQNELQKREKIITDHLERLGFPDKKLQKLEPKMTLEDAIQMIQIHERARQGRLRAKFMQQIRKREEREKKRRQHGAPTIDIAVAATKIQKVWRGNQGRKMARKEKELEFIFLGMVPPPPSSSGAQTPEHVARKIEANRRALQAQYERDYEQALDTIKQMIRHQEGADMREAMQDQIRKWMLEFRDKTGKFPEYPDVEDGGSASIFCTKKPDELDSEQAGQEGEKGKKGEEKGKKGKDKGKKGKGDDGSSKANEMQESKFVPEIVKACVTYKSVWQHRDEADNYLQRYDVELIKEEKRPQVEAELREEVDALMREELENLRLAVEQDKGKKGKKGKSGKKKKKKGSKSGKKGKKKEKDHTADRTMESLFEELVSEGIIVTHPKVHVADYLGEYSYLGTTLQQANIEPMPSLSDVRRVVTEYACLPLGSKFVHERAPHITSMILVGPRGTGKRMLVDAICTDTGATLFDLTAENLGDRYPGKKGLEMLLHLVYKVGKHYAPSVIYVGNAERLFAKKSEASETCDPKRLKKDLPKLVRKFVPGERVLLVGTSRAPFDADIKGILATFQKIVLLPRPDYASRFVLWKSLIKKHGGRLDAKFDLSSLSKVSDGYTSAHINIAVKEVLTERRLIQQHMRALTTVEFTVTLAKIDPIYREEEEAFKNWYSKTPMGKKRFKETAGAPGDDEEKEKKRKKSAKKK